MITQVKSRDAQRVRRVTVIIKSSFFVISVARVSRLCVLFLYENLWLLASYSLVTCFAWLHIRYIFYIFDASAVLRYFKTCA